MKLSIRQSPIHRSTAERSLERALQFLRAYGTDSTIKAAVDTTGFTGADQKEGWSLVLRAYAAPSSQTFTPDAGPVGDAVREVDAWQQLMFPRAHAALSTNPVLVQSARAVLALPPKSNGATPGSNGASVSGGGHA